jgi:hypothetical protein
MRDATARHGRLDPLAKEKLLSRRLVRVPGLRELVGVQNLAGVVQDGSETHEVRVDGHAHALQGFEQEIRGLTYQDAVLQEPLRRTELR